MAKWVGNTPSIALRYYVDPTDEAFERAKNWTPVQTESGREKAGQNPVQQNAEWGRTMMNVSSGPFSETPDFPQDASSCELVGIPQVAEAGFEPARRFALHRILSPERLPVPPLGPSDGAGLRRFFTAPLPLTLCTSYLRGPASRKALRARRGETPGHRSREGGAGGARREIESD